MLSLASETPKDWARRAASQIEEVLLDHAHCEKKAAGAAVRMLFRYPQHEFLQQPMTELAREELEHYQRVLALLAARGIPFGRQKPSAYGGRLHRLVRAEEPHQLIDLLLVSALIEARSCERFRLLSETLEDTELASLYADLLGCEARHHHAYVDLAHQLAPSPSVRQRLAELACSEAEILAIPSARVRLHS
jgi:tRNA-(ms[2]io[6]A)-hydroxylase